MSLLHHPHVRVGSLAALSALALATSTLVTAPTAHAEGSCTRVASPGDDLPGLVDQLPEGATLCLGDGNWFLDRPISPRRGQSIIGTGRSVLEGSVPLGGWRPEGDDWVLDGQLRSGQGVGECEDQSSLCTLPEDLYDGNRILTRVADWAPVGPGQYRADYAGNTLRVGGDPAAHQYHLGRTRAAVHSSQPGVTLRGLVVQGFANPAQQGAVQVDGDDWTLDGLRVTQNHGAGIALAGVRGTTIRSSEVTENGQIGVIGAASRSTTLDGVWVHDNNTAGFWRGDWEAGGVKFTRATDTTVRNSTVSANHGIGIWADLWCDGMELADNVINDNDSDGVRFEISRRASIHGNHVSGNAHRVGRGGGTSIWAGGGIVVSTASDVQVDGNALSANQHGISVQYRNRGEGPWGQATLSDVVVRGNRVDLTTGGALVGAVGDQDRWDALYGGAVRFSGNTYTVPATSPARFATRWSTGDFAQWQAAGFDSDGRLVAA